MPAANIISLLQYSFIDPAWLQGFAIVVFPEMRTSSLGVFFYLFTNARYKNYRKPCIDSNFKIKKWKTEGYFFIPDISGFTRFVNETEIDHSRLIIQELLEILINSNQIGLEVSEIEGDAILFYKFGESP